MSNPVLRLLIILTMLFSAGCGWQLRGDYELPEQLMRIQLQASQPDHPFTLRVQRALTVAGVELVSAKEANAVLRIGKLKRDLRNVAVDSNGRPSEKGLWLSVPVSVNDHNDTVLLDRTDLLANRIYRYDPNNVVAKGEEERLIEQELYDNLVGQLMRRLRRIHTEAEAH